MIDISIQKILNRIIKRILFHDATFIGNSNSVFTNKC